ncbi:hypothetical protein MPH_04415 [Macrophomina phaseolina MS6]|uniref:Uncharacterized protein n=1 Tax=Macrophomina phaseolina (strain MS6) TaxID=1126212 RepID=K2RU58_MACPH|nr:hypothetical protein MPH_04415 [Macrophomina phaseolina MS6]
MIPSSVPVRESVPSASPIPLSGHTSRNGTNRVASPLTPPDHGVAQVVTPIVPSDGVGSASDEWRKLLASARSSFDNERRVWEQERQLYQQDIARLRAALDAKQHEMLVMTTKLKQAELALGDPRSFHSHIVSPPSATNSRVSPIKSPPTADQNGCPVSPPTQAGSSRQSSLTSHPGIPGMQYHPSRFNVAHHGMDGMTTVGGARVSNIEEEPPSPVSTAAHLSPPPEAYRRHAGHTPGKAGSFSMETTPGEKTPKAIPPPAPVEEDVAVQSESSEDEDPPMQEPLFLPSRPDRPEGSSMLDVLQEKLSVISEHPEEQRPAVLQGIPPSETSESEVDPLDNAASLPVDPVEVEEGPSSAKQVPGIRLKTKRSYNFGAPIGEMPKRNAADFEGF